jgi:hypothetical protein
MMDWKLGSLIVACVASCSSDGDERAGAISEKLTATGLGHLLGCVAPRLEGDYIAWWGFDNDSNAPIMVPIGNDNHFSPAPASRGQPEVFPVGGGRFEFSTRFDGTPLTWNLLGKAWSATWPSSRPCVPAAGPISLDAPQNIVIWNAANVEVMESAALLSRYLQRITGLSFPVVRSPRPGGITLGIEGDFGTFNWPFTAGVFNPASVSGREGYVVWTHPASSARSATIAGATGAALRRAVWEFLYQIGYRQYFPGILWEVLPTAPIQNKTISIAREPAYFVRFVQNDTSWTERQGDDDDDAMYQAFLDWREKNQAASIPRSTRNEEDTTGGWKFSQGAYSDIKSTWEHLHCPGQKCLDPIFIPNTLCVETRVHVDGVCDPGVACVSAESVAAEYASIRFAEPAREALSMSPLDGTMNWDACSSSEPAPIDRVIRFANAAASVPAAANKVVGVVLAEPTLLQPPESQTIAPNILIAQLNTGRVDERLERWHDAGAKLLGIRDNLGESDRSANVPGVGRLTNPAALSSQLAAHRAAGARWYSAVEAPAAWAPYGLSYYVMARTLLTGEVQDPDALRSDFVARAFGPAAPGMTRFFDALDHGPLFGSNLLGRMYSALRDARDAVTEPVILERIEHLAVYARFLEYFHEYDCGGACSADDRCPAALPGIYESMVRFLYSTRTTQLIDSRAFFGGFDVQHHTACVCEGLPEHSLLPPAAAGNCPPRELPSGPLPRGCAPLNPWKQDPFPDMNLEITRGAAVYQPIDSCLLRSYSDDLVPAVPAHPPTQQLETAGFLANWMSNSATSRWYAWLDSPGQLGLDVRPTAPAQTVNVTATLLWRSSLASAFEPIHSAGIFFAKTEEEPQRRFFLSSPQAGLHRLEVGPGRYDFRWDTGTKIVRLAGVGPERWALRGRPSLLFYVPAGTQAVVGWTSGNDVGRFKTFRRVAGSPNVWTGQETPRLPTCSDDFVIPVQDNDQDQIWGTLDIPGSSDLVLRSVPPVLARRPEEFLLPREVVEANGNPPRPECGP